PGETPPAADEKDAANSDSAQNATQCLRSLTASLPERRPGPPPDQKAQGPVKVPAEQTGEGVLFPALVIGLGSLGLNVLRRLHAEMEEERLPGQPGGVAGFLGAAAADDLPHLRFLIIDTDPEVLRQIGGAAGRGPGLTAANLVLTPLNRPSYYLKPREG